MGQAPTIDDSEYDPFVAEVLAGALPGPDPAMHSADAIDSALQRFWVDSSEAAPYFYRYLAANVPESTRGCEFVNEMLQAEKRAVSEPRLWPVGRRWAAVKVT
ncbi:MAG TPA: hypothetical protein VGF16_19600 [Bryobacteraceae bacterium]|jgi:hypothetical protein